MTSSDMAPLLHFFKALANENVSRSWDSGQSGVQRRRVGIGVAARRATVSHHLGKLKRAGW